MQFVDQIYTQNTESNDDFLRKRSHSISSVSSSDGSYDGRNQNRKKSKGRNKMDEVDRLAEMERQRRVREAEQKVNSNYTY